jgi:predicted metal-dependent phosphoesterase TrpH
VIDLHSHSTASDGSLGPAALVALARSRGLSALALTDHDTVGGVAEALAAAAEAPAAAAEAPAPFRLIAGVEIEIAFMPGEFHLLGLDLDPARLGGRLAEAMEGLGKARDARNHRIMGHIRDAGIPATMEELRAIARGGSPRGSGEPRIGRPHFASLLVARRAAKNRQDAFNRWLAKGRPFYEPKECLSLPEAIALVKAAGGLAFVAHPLSLFISWSRLEALMPEWKELGIDGIEAWHPTAKAGECRRLEKLGRAHGFRISAGSDYHGDARPDRKLGRTAGGIPIVDGYLDAIAR